MPHSAPPGRTSRPSFPVDYSICPVCNLDHRHDVPRLGAEERMRVLHMHLDDHPVPPYDLLVTTEAP